MMKTMVALSTIVKIDMKKKKPIRRLRRNSCILFYKKRNGLDGELCHTSLLDVHLDILDVSLLTLLKGPQERCFSVRPSLSDQSH